MQLKPGQTHLWDDGQIHLTADTQIFSGFFAVREVKFALNPNPPTPIEKPFEHSRVYLDMRDSVSVLIYHRGQDATLLVRQFRYPTFTRGEPRILELPAGMIEKGEAATDAALREVYEETGVKVASVAYVQSYFLAPGTSNQRAHLFFAEFKENDPPLMPAYGHGLASEGEQIETVLMSRQDGLCAIRDREIIDATTLIGLMWLEAYLAHTG